MGKNSKKRHAKRNRKTIPRKPLKRQGLLSKIFYILSPTGWFCALIVFFLTFVTAYYTFAFKFVIIPNNQINLSNPFLTSFTLRNESLLWVNLVNPYKCFYKKINTTIDVKITDNTVTTIKPSIPVLDPGEQTSFSISFPFNFGNDQITFADIQIVVSYYPAFLPLYGILERKHSQRFITYRSKNGTYQWEHKAKSE